MFIFGGSFCFVDMARYTMNDKFINWCTVEIWVCVKQFERKKNLPKKLVWKCWNLYIFEKLQTYKFILEKHIVTMHGYRVDKCQKAVPLTSVRKLSYKNKFDGCWTWLVFSDVGILLCYSSMCSFRWVLVFGFLLHREECLQGQEWHQLYLFFQQL